MQKLDVAGLIIALNAPDWVFHQNLQTFVTEIGEPSIICKIVFEKQPILPKENGVAVVKEFVYDVCGEYHRWVGCEDDIPNYTISSTDWSNYTMYIDPKYNDPTDADTVLLVREGIFFRLRDALVAALAKNNGLIIHSSSIIYQNKCVLFSAASGTGKSTHTAMWNVLYHVPILNGDSAACRIIDGSPVAFGIPWCGMSGQFIKHHAPLSAIVFLEQAKENSIVKLDTVEAFMRLTERCIMLRWSESLTKASLATIQSFVESVDCYLLKCLPDHGAVELVKKCLE